MKQLISATLSEEAATIYNNWENYKKNYHLLNYILPNEDIEYTQICIHMHTFR